MTINIDKLQALAEKAIDSTIGLDRFNDAIEPETVLALIRIARAAKGVLNPNPEDPDASLYKLSEALQALEDTP